jgi:hypothetical protein
VIVDPGIVRIVYQLIDLYLFDLEHVCSLL